MGRESGYGVSQRLMKVREGAAALVSGVFDEMARDIADRGYTDDVGEYAWA